MFYLLVKLISFVSFRGKNMFSYLNNMWKKFKIHNIIINNRNNNTTINNNNKMINNNNKMKINNNDEDKDENNKAINNRANNNRKTVNNHKSGVGDVIVVGDASNDGVSTDGFISIKKKNIYIK